MGTHIQLIGLPLRSFWAVTLGAAVWLCPIWWIPTPAVMPLLWGASCLALWLLIEQFCNRSAQSNAKLNPLFYLLLISLACMIAWRSASAPNTLAALLCILCIALSANVSARFGLTGATSKVAWAWLIAGFANSAIGLVQYFGWTAEPLGTAFGLLRQRNQLATLCNIALLSLLYLWRVHRRKSSTTNNILTQPLAILACWVLTAALAATCSRAGLIELLCLSFLALGYAILKERRELGFAIVFVLLSYLLWAWILPLVSGIPETIFGRVSSGTLQDSRLLLWANTASIIQVQPWLGVGWRELAHSLSTTDFGLSPRFAHQADNAHNLPLQFAAELGVPFATLWFALLAWLVLRHKPWRTKSPEQALGWGVLAVIGLHSLLEYPLWYAPFQIAVGLSAGLAFVQPKSTVPRQTYAAAGQYTYGLAGIGLLCFCAYAAFDYNRVRQLYIEDAKRWSAYRQGTFDKAKESWLFAAQVRFAKVTTTPVNAQNAAEVWLLGHEVLHFSPEPLVFEALIRAGEWLALEDPKIAAELAHYKRILPNLQ